MSSNESAAGRVAPSRNFGLYLSNLPLWAKLAAGAVVLLALPFYKRVLRIEDSAEGIVKTVAEEVKVVAGVVEKVAEELARVLPEGSLLQERLELIGHVAEELEKDAGKAEELLEEVDEIKEKVEEALQPLLEEEKSLEGDVKENEREHQEEQKATQTHPKEEGEILEQGERPANVETTVHD